MSDKDYSACEFIAKNAICRAYCNGGIAKPCGCINNPNCYYKQLQAGEGADEAMDNGDVFIPFQRGDQL